MVIITIHGSFPNTFLKEPLKEWSWSVMVMVMGGGATRDACRSRRVMGVGAPGPEMNHDQMVIIFYFARFPKDFLAGRGLRNGRVQDIGT